MSQWHLKLRALRFGVAVAATLGVGTAAWASDPLPNDSVAPPVNINFGIFYNELINSGAFAPGVTGAHTHVATDVTVLRYVHTFKVKGLEAGVQMYLPIVEFLGRQTINGRDATSHSGFGQPNFSLFFWPVNSPATGTYVVVSPWVSPPIGGFNPDDTLNPTSGTPGNAWFEEIEIGARTLLMGTPKTPNLALEGWTTTYFYQSNPHFRVRGTPFGALGASYRQQPEEELRAYAIYTINPVNAATIALGYYQSFGGKQTMKIPKLGQLGLDPIVDTGQRTSESQLRLFGSIMATRTVQIGAYIYYDIAAHGGAKKRLIGIRVAKLF
jgi:hypothetical protein